MREIDINDSVRQRKSQNFYTIPGEVDNTLTDIRYTLMKSVPKGIKQVAFLSKVTEDDAKAEGLDNLAINDLAALLTPPTERYSTAVTPQAAQMANQMDNLATQQLIKQFYEVYIVPVGYKDIYNRLGEIAGNIEDMHLLYPSGLKGIIGADPNASWRTNLNFSFSVDEGLKNNQNQNISTTYSSLAFPPFISHDVVDVNDLAESLNPKEEFEEEVQDSTFDMKNILYKKNRGTYRFPAFKAVNDNIHTLQVLLNRCFGVESTFINEWDLSIYMQEGLCSFIEKETQDDSGNITKIKQPTFVTTLTYGLLDDAPLEGNKEGTGNVDINEAAMFATVNMAVSTRKGIDDFVISKGANEQTYQPNKYGYSAYWRPWDDGEVNTVSYKNGVFNMSDYIRTMFSFDENANTYNERNPNGRNYTPSIFHGDLSASTKTFQRILNYTDDRYAVLSGWNATDSSGKTYMRSGDLTNGNRISNAFSYLPFWKQFYTSEEDGMTDIDLYMQEVIASKKDLSFLDAAYNIIQIITENNDHFTDLKDNAWEDDYVQNVLGRPISDEDVFDKTDAPRNSGDGEPSDYAFKLFKCKLKIPGSKLLKMFLKRKSKSVAAQQDVKDVQANNNTSSVVGAQASAEKSPAEETLDENGNPVTVTTFTPAFDDGLCNKKTVGDGIAEFSPFLYGGPHGKFASPLTLEGYTQPANETLSGIPSADVYSIFNGNRYSDNTKATDATKNYKNTGSYLDVVTCATPIERNMLLTNAGSFGIRGAVPNTKRWKSYTARSYYRDWHAPRKTITKTEYSSCYCSSYSWGSYRNNSSYGWSRTYTVDDPFYAKIHRHHSYRHWWWWSWHQISEDFHNETHPIAVRRSYYLPEDEACIDFENNFYLYPVDMGKSEWVSSVSELRSLISNDVNGFRAIYNNPEKRVPGSRIWWLITPRGGNLNWSRNIYGDSSPNASYYSPNNAWEDQLKDLYNKGVREKTVSLPIKDTRGNVTNIVCGVATIVKKEISTWRWVFHCNWNWYWDYPGRCHRRHWWCYYRHWYWWHSYRWEKVTTTSYHLCIDPGRLKYNVPTASLLNRELKISYAASQRKKDSANIIERWQTTPYFNHIDDGSNNSPKLFPFSLEFNSRYGQRSYGVVLPLIPSQYTRGVSIHRMNSSLKRLKTGGVYFKDIFEEYAKTGRVVQVTGIRRTYDVIRDWYSRRDTIAEENGYWTRKWVDNPNQKTRYWWQKRGHYEWKFKQDECEFFRDTGTYHRYVNFVANVESRRVSSSRTSTKMTNLISEIHKAPSIMQVFSSANVSKMSAYKTSDIFDTYIETATSQLSWLQQLKDYANLYIKDHLIYSVYQKSVDLQTQKIMFNEKNGASYKLENGGVGYTNSYTEDINYHDALAIVERLFNTDNKNRNTILELVEKRIRVIKALKAAAVFLKSLFNIYPRTSMDRFVELVTNTRSILNGAQNTSGKAEDKLFTNGVYNYTLFNVNDVTTYDLVRNPAAALWGYLNVLYHVRRFWVNNRFNKRAGSYWVLRGLERVMYFLLASQESEAANSSDSVIADGKISSVTSMDITFSQPRISFVDQIKTKADTVYTKAVYVKVDYMKTGDPKSSSKWDSESNLYAGNEVVYVEKAFKWAFKPADGLYYIMSSEISNTIKQYLASLKLVNQNIYGNTYAVSSSDLNEIKRVLQSKIESPETGESVESLRNSLAVANYFFANFEEDITIENMITRISEVVSSLQIPTTEVTNAFTDMKNILLRYKADSYLESIRENIYAVYIRWSPSKVWTGLNSENGEYHIDTWQLKNTAGKERHVKDFYGLDHTTTEAISAGITFDAVAGIDIGTILSSPTALKTASPIETLCASVNTMDLWRVELPEALYVNIKLLKDKPVLVPADIIEAGFETLNKKQITATEKTVLAGVQSTLVLPVTEAEENMLTINSLAALGEFKELGDAVSV